MGAFTRPLWLIGLALCFAGNVYAQVAGASAGGPWRSLGVKSDKEQARGLAVIPLAPDRYAQFALDEAAMRSAMAAMGSAPQRDRPSAAAPLPGGISTVTMPLPSGEMMTLLLEESETMAPELAAQFPQLKTYRVVSGGDERVISGVADITEQGFHAMLNTTLGVVFIDPRTDSRGARSHISYFKHDYNPPTKKRFPSAPGRPDALERSLPRPALAGRPQARAVSGTERIVYRLAVATTGEYTAYQGGVTKALSAVVTTVNRVNSVYERDLSVHLTLVANNQSLIFTSTSKYVNDDDEARLNKNQEVLDQVIGRANYDIGHVFATGGAGLAQRPSVCDPVSKAQGTTGNEDPVGDPFDIDYVAHEMGHQLGGSHTYNLNERKQTCDTGELTRAYEPGSGSTIMSYAGICNNSNLQKNADAMFHAGSIAEIRDTIDDKTGGNYCGTRTGLNNAVPTANAGPAFTIPARTPFALTGSGSDANGNPLTYTWDQMDLGKQSTSNKDMDDDGAGPLFRSFLPSTSPTRVFPRLADLLANRSDYGGHLPVLPAESDTGERLPKTSRNLNFRFTVRDQGGGVADADVTLVVDKNAGPFAVTAPNGAETLGSTTTVKWNVAGTTAAPISCANVDVLLSNDGGNSFATTLASAVPNNGAALVTFPSGASSTARVKVQCSGNIFFALSQADFAYASTCAFSLSQSSFSVGAAKSTQSLNVATGCSWQVASHADWVVPSVSAGASVSGSGAVILVVSANTSTSSRSATVTVAGQSVSIVQQAAPVVCSLALSSSASSVGSGLAAGNFNVTAPAGCSFTSAASSTGSWLTVKSASPLTGSGSVQFSAAANTASTARSGSITVTSSAGSQVFTLTQQGVPPACTYAFDDADGAVSVGAKLYSGHLGVTTGASCAWTVVSNASWITVTGGARNVGPATVLFSLSANTGTAARSATITVAGKAYSVKQSGATVACSYNLGSSQVSLDDQVVATDAAGGAGSVTVSTASTCAWTAVSQVSWMVVNAGASGRGNGTVFITILANTGVASRSGQITIADKTYTVDQAGSNASCTYYVATTDATVTGRYVLIGAPDAGTGTVAVSTNPGCRWSAASAVGWISFGSSSGTGSAPLSVSVSANTGSTPRSGAVTIAGQSFIVTQAGTVTACSYGLDSSVSSAYDENTNTVTLGSDGATGNIFITTSAACAWTARSAAPWLSIDAGSAGSGVGTVLVSASANTTGLARDTTLSVAGQTINVRQVAAGSAVLSPTETIYPKLGSWWNPAEGGSGFTLDGSGSTLVMSVYTYDASGLPTWYVAAGALTNHGTTWSGSLDKTRGGQCIGCPYQAPVGAGSDGSFSVQFTSNTTGVMTLPGGKKIEIQSFFPAGSAPAFGTTASGGAGSPAKPKLGTWWNRSEPGSGFTLDGDGNTLVMGVYVYAPDGSPSWYLAAGPLVSGEASWTGTLNKTQGGQCLGCTFKVPASVGNDGSLRVAFLSDTDAFMTLPNGRRIYVESFFPQGSAPASATSP